LKIEFIPSPHRGRAAAGCRPINPLLSDSWQFQPEQSYSPYSSSWHFALRFNAMFTAVGGIICRIHQSHGLNCKSMWQRFGFALPLWKRRPPAAGASASQAAFSLNNCTHLYSGSWQFSLSNRTPLAQAAGNSA
jgi:hypothetical protein